MTEENIKMEALWPFLTDTNKRDDDGTIMPWYTFGALEWINNNIPMDKSQHVLEFGGGHSTLWWRQRAWEVRTIEFNADACAILNIPVSSPKSFFDDYEPTTVYDVVIVDSEAEMARQDYVKRAFDMSKRYVIIDNFQQNEVCMYDDETVEYLINNSKEHFIFNQPQHRDGSWKTAIFIK
jgi:hypothetical protein